ncbi:MAG: type VI secretion system protein TssA [Alphaproteobacteria bacterium]|nr:type VI secretion system protein TssA [Alphaproteobacteria bacterium]
MINIEDFLNPISENSMCGKNLRYEHVYDQIKEYRREDDPQLSQGIWQTDTKRANWTELHQLCAKLLKTETKDLQIAMWLTESLIVEQGFRGLNLGLQLVYSLCSKFWDEIFPSIDWENHNYDYRLSPFFFLADKMPDRIVLIPLTDNQNEIVYALSDWMMARRNLQIKNHKGLSLKEIGKQVAISSMKVFEDISVNVSESISKIRKIKQFLDDQGIPDVPSFQQLENILDDIQRITNKNIEIKQKQIKTSSVKTVPEISTQQETQILEESLNKTESSQGKQAELDEPTVSQAYQALKEIAAFLEKKQPQSPAYTLVKIAHIIGEKSFQELLEINMSGGASVLTTISELYKIFNQKPSESPTEGFKNSNSPGFSDMKPL